MEGEKEKDKEERGEGVVTGCVFVLRSAAIRWLSAAIRLLDPAPTDGEGKWDGGRGEVGRSEINWPSEHGLMIVLIAFW